MAELLPDGWNTGTVALFHGYAPVSGQSLLTRWCNRMKGSARGALGAAVGLRPTRGGRPPSPPRPPG